MDVSIYVENKEAVMSIYIAENIEDVNTAMKLLKVIPFRYARGGRFNIQVNISIEAYSIMCGHITDKDL